MEYKGLMTSVEARENTILIKNAETTEVNYSDIKSIVISPAKLMHGGFIKFVTDQEPNIPNVVNAGFDRNTVLISWSGKDINNAAAEEFKKFVEGKISESKKSEEKANPINHNNNTSVADELLKLKKLLDDGIITQDEFNKMKQDLLK